MQTTLSIVLPCLNEEEGLQFCLPKIKTVLEHSKISAEILVVDNGSSDRSGQVAAIHQATLIRETERGYGAACMRGLEAGKGKYLFLADADGSYDFSEIPNFLKQLESGADFVIGDRFKGKIENGAMPWSHHHIGNPVLSYLFRLFFKTNIHDIHCGMRAISKTAYQKLSLKTTGMEFASEMVLMAIKKKLRISELPIDYHKRKGRSKLRRLSDGWRHLRFMLLYSPLFLFFIPGLLLFLIGIASMIWFCLGNPEILGIKLYFHPMFLSALAVMTGYQLIIFAVFAKTYAITHLDDNSKKINQLYQYWTLEKAIIVGVLLGFSGLAIYGGIIAKWITSRFGALNEIKNSVIALTLLVIGIQTIFSGFMLSILGIKEK